MKLANCIYEEKEYVENENIFIITADIDGKLKEFIAYSAKEYKQFLNQLHLENIRVKSKTKMPFHKFITLVKQGQH